VRRPPRLRTPKLDFIVIGAQKAGTTSLWRYLEDNPKLLMPPDKEASFFSEPQYPDALRAYMRALFKDAPRGKLLGKITPAYMTGTPGISVPAIAGRIHETVPRVRLVAVLRDPVERALSAHRMWTRFGEEDRPFETAIAELLQPDALERARRGPSIRDSYVVSGEYGWMLRAYVERFGAEQLHVELSADLDASAEDVVARVCRFIGVEPHRPARLGQRFNPSGPPLLGPEAEADLKDYLGRHVWPRMKHGAQHRDHFDQWFLRWNSVPDPEPAPGVAAPAVDPATERRLREHYAADARLLEAELGLRVPWAAG
jgi:hypothetical protein